MVNSSGRMPCEANAVEQLHEHMGNDCCHCYTSKVGFVGFLLIRNGVLSSRWAPQPFDCGINSVFREGPLIS